MKSHRVKKAHDDRMSRRVVMFAPVLTMQRSCSGGQSRVVDQLSG
jgi:hypothetical protein